MANKKNRPKRLIHFQSVGHSNADPETGRISPAVFNKVTGWQEHIDRTLHPLVKRLGANFDWWGHNTGGVWDDPSVSNDRNGAMLFHQWAIAKERNPALWNMEPLHKYTKKKKIKRFGYVGYPLCDGQAPRNFKRGAKREQDCNFCFFNEAYGPFKKYDFHGVGHDWSGHWQKCGPWQANVHWLKEHNIDTYVEALPPPEPHFNGLSVIAAEWIWEASEVPGQTRFATEEKIKKHGGNCIHLILNPKRSDPVRDEPGYDPIRWRYDTALRLLKEGKTVCVPLAGLWQHDLEKLVVASLNGIDKVIVYINFLANRYRKKPSPAVIEEINK